MSFAQPGNKGSGRLFDSALFKLALLFGILLFLLSLVSPDGMQSPEKESVRLVFAGDIMLDGVPSEEIAQGRDPFVEFAPLLAEADCAVGNLKCVVATVGERVEKPWTFRAHPRVLPVLARHFGAVSLANNHTGDFGHKAFLQQLDLLRGQSIPFFGGGSNNTEARAPLIVERRGLRIALLGYNEFKPRSFEAGPDSPGVAWSDDGQVVADLRAARAVHKADLVIPYMHWGWEEYPTSPRQKQLARLMIDHGADVVIGSHPHIVQETEMYKGRLIVYSLGNFVFDGFKTDPTRTGWLLRLTLSRYGLAAWDTVVAKLDDKGIPRLARDVPSPRGEMSLPMPRRIDHGPVGE